MSLPAVPFRQFLALIALIGANVALHRHGAALGLSAPEIRFGIGALWAAAIYFVVAVLLRSRPRKQALMVAAFVCLAVELSKLIHTPALDILRLTPVGAAVLGRAFEWLDFPAYAAGLAAATGLDILIAGKWRNPFAKKASRSRRR
jgi:hypothetical protein